MWVHVKNAQNNPFQTRGIIEPNVKAIMESIGSTSAGFWDNILATPVKGDVPDLSGMNKEEQLKATKGFKYYLAYGHQRTEAVRRLKIEHIDIPIKPLTEKEMLVICCNENLETYGGDVMTNIGSIGQVYDRVKNEMDAVESWQAYTKKGFDMLTTKAQFENCKKQGIGYRVLQTILGKAWPINTVRGAKAAHDGIAAGLYSQEEIQGFPSMDAIARFSSLARDIMGLDYPEAYKREIVAVTAATVAKVGATGKVIDLARKGLESGYDPIAYVKDQIPKPLAKDFMAKVRAILAAKGEMYKDIDKGTLEEAKSQLAKQASDEKARAEREAAGGEPDPTPVPDGTDSEPSVLGGEDGGGLPASFAFNNFNLSAPLFVAEVDNIVDHIQETNDSDTLTNMAGILHAVVKLYTTRFGYKALRGLITQIEKGE